MKVVLNSDTELVKEIKTKLKENQGFCPCRLTKTPDTKCMCKEFRGQIKNGIEGLCHCELYNAIKE